MFKRHVRTVRHCRPDSRTSAASNFHIRLCASGPWGKNVRTAILQHAISISDMRASGPWKAGVRTVEVESAMSILVARTSGPRITDFRTVIFELRFLPYIWVRPDGKPHRPNGCINLPLFWTWKESEADRSFRGVRTGCWDVRTDASWNGSFLIQYRSGRKYTSSGRMMLGLSGVWTVWHVVRKDGTMDKWASGRDGTVVRTADKEPEFFKLSSSAESSESALNSGIPVYSIFTYRWFFPNRMRPIILT
jgi:hypothetical protein